MSFDINKLTQELLDSDGPIIHELEMTKKKLEDIKKNVTLIVDDDPTNRMVLKTLLEMQGSTVKEAENGLIAVEIYKSDRNINLIYMDIMMPVMNGIEATKQIRKYEKDNKLDQVNIIAVTAYSESEKECLSVGIDKVVLKPIQPKDL